MRKYKVWLLRLVLPGRYGGILTAALMLLILVPFFRMGLTPEGTDDPPVMFFSLIPAYIIPLFKFITDRARESLDDLRPILTIDDTQFHAHRDSLDSQSLGTTLTWMAAAVFFGFSHMALLRGSYPNAVEATLGSTGGLLSTLGAVLIWIVMTTVIVKLVEQAIVFSKLGARHTQLSLLNFQSLLPFGRVSMSASLVVFGALMLFPLINVGEDSDLAESVPGAIAASIPLVVIFVIPVWPLHKRLKQLRESELLSLNRQITEKTGGGHVSADATSTLEEISPLLMYRQEVARTPTWPFDLGNIARLAFYFVIIPLTWVGAALIENVVDAFL